MITAESVCDNIEAWKAGDEKLDVRALYDHLAERYGPRSPTDLCALLFAELYPLELEAE